VLFVTREIINSEERDRIFVVEMTRIFKREREDFHSKSNIRKRDSLLLERERQKRHPNKQKKRNRERKNVTEDTL
jgi:hypothetical protein